MKSIVRPLKSLMAAGLVALVLNSGCEYSSSRNEYSPEERTYSRDPDSANFRVAQPGEYPCIDDNLYFNTNYFGLANFKMEMREGFWLYEPYSPDPSQTNLPTFEIFKDHKGGIGDTLEIVDYSKGIYFQWAWGGLHTVSVFGNWQGNINESGIRLGNSREDFRTAYPDAQRDKKRRFDPNCESWVTCLNSQESADYYNTEGEIRLNADIDSQGRIFRLRLGAWDGDNYNGYWGP